MAEGIKPREITHELLHELSVWTRQSPMFLSSPQGKAFGVELREVFDLAHQALDMKEIRL